MNVEPTITKVHEDARGEMYSIQLPGDRELMLLHSKAGSLRGGHSHDVPESVMVLLGRMCYHKHRENGTTQMETLGDGDSSRNRAGVDHMGEFVEDTWLIEWKSCKDKQSWRNTDYAPWRERVKANAGS